MQTTSIDLETKSERAPVEAGVIVKFGLDVHALQITACRQIDGANPQPSQKLSWARCVEWIQAQVRAGARVYSCYEAGPCGYGLHRQLTALGVVNYVVSPQCWDERGQKVKTDRRDARQLCERLDRYVRGNTHAFAVVWVPTPEQEQRRALCRQRGNVLRERQRCELRGHGLMLAQGIIAPAGWWESKPWAELASKLPPWLRENLRWWQSQAVRLQGELDRLTNRVEALSAGAGLPKGEGALSAALLQAEMVTWSRFHNRRQVGSYTGLCPSEFSTGQHRCQGSVTKHGNPRVRHLLVEMVWRLLAWQPDYPPLRAVRAAQSPRAKKRAVVAAARRLAVDLWRINTGQCRAAQLGLRLNEP
jgi:transposase